MTLAPEAHAIDADGTTNLMEYKVGFGTNKLLNSSLRQNDHLLSRNGAPTIAPHYYRNPGRVTREASEVATIHTAQLEYSTPYTTGLSHTAPLDALAPNATPLRQPTSSGHPYTP